MKIALCKKSEDIPNGRYLYEPKLDGIRAVSIDGKLYNRDGKQTGRDISEKFPEIKPPVGYALDGEIVNHKGFRSVVGRINTTDKFKIKMKSKVSPCRFVAFDILAKGDTDYRNEKIEKRKSVLKSQDKVKKAEGVEIIRDTRNGGGLWKEIAREGKEGIVAKKLGSPYPMGRRSKDWKKIKNFDSEVFDVKRWEETEEGGFVVVISTEGGEQRIVVNSKKEQKKIRQSKVEQIAVKFLEKTDKYHLRFPAYRGIV